MVNADPIRHLRLVAGPSLMPAAFYPSALKATGSFRHHAQNITQQPPLMSEIAAVKSWKNTTQRGSRVINVERISEPQPGVDIASVKQRVSQAVFDSLANRSIVYTTRASSECVFSAAYGDSPRGVVEFVAKRNGPFIHKAETSKPAAVCSASPV